MTYRCCLFMFCLGLLSLLTARPAEAADPFSIVFLPDTQHYSDSASRIVHFNNQTQWLVDNYQNENIVFVSHLGDIVEHGGDLTEWDRADTAMDILDTAPDLPYGAVLGNHDYDTSGSYLPNNPATNYVSYFGSDRYDGKSWYGGAGPDERNHYQLFSAGGRDFLHFSLEYRAASTNNSDYAGVVSWAQNTMDTYEGYPTIISTHQYLSSSGSRESGGTDIFNALVKDNPQVFMVFNGHSPGIAHQTAQNTSGDDVFEILADYQGEGNGWLRIMEFNEDASEINAITYSPSLDNYKTDAENQFTLPIDFNERLGYAGPPPPPPYTSSWRNDRMGDWNDRTNWVGDTPATTDRSAVFGDSITTDRTIIVDTDVTARGVIFDNTNGYTIAGLGTLTIEDGVEADPPAPMLAPINVTQGDHEFQLAVVLGSDAEIYVETGASLTFNGPVSLDGYSLIQTGGGAVYFNNSVSGGSVSAGMITGTETVDGDQSLGSPVPEPTSIFLLLVGVMGLAGMRKRK